MYRNTALITLFYGLVYASMLYANPVLRKPVYVGAHIGFGSTTWRGLVPTKENQNMALNISTPIHVKEGGEVFGVFTGYEFTPYFAIEANYRHYPRAKVTFDSFSLFAFDHEDRTSFNTDTEAVSLMAKVMLTVPKTTLRIYSSFGAAYIHRDDEITQQFKLAPTFGAGFNIDVTPHVMVDIGFNYISGYGESELNPAKTYIPFLYSGTIGLAYRI